ncbi:thiamine ABC transporter substrate-binding protein [Serinibacter salmoneus]|uniref:Thiamine transport system substrate-binding protein n=1 Tax=Serinibacter salmoneus TaxID=556530 RepID=A0A2A9CW60_9MICO|nr:thiamine ABC transporter substrate-binding protein [Serinibacter salmoneus]PFG18667.1 thiamine transport system substrate-binding protein [Serinibacter salmoneus]
MTRTIHRAASSQRRTPARAAALGLAAALTLTLAACADSESDTEEDAASASASSGEGEGQEAAPSSITVVSHDSFNLSEGLLESFTEETGIEVTLVAPGDGGALVNQLVLTKDSPLGDVVYGVDNTFASRAIEEGVLETYTSPMLPVSAEDYMIGEELTPIDVSDVCLNIDDDWFEAEGLTPPTTFEDLTEPEYAGLTVVTNPATSSPGLAMLAATVGAFGEDGWLEYWEALAANDLLVVDGWSDAYFVDFSGADGEGSRPIVLSYASSPPYTVGEDGEPTTSALLDTCFRQVEYAGVITGAANPEGAREFIDFLLSSEVQADVPGQMYVYPVDDTVELPEDWAAWAPLADSPHTVPAQDIAANRSEWIEQWTATVLG